MRGTNSLLSWLRLVCLLCAVLLGLGTIIATSPGLDEEESDQSLLQGRFLDSAVIGVSYTAGSNNGMTGPNGDFTYINGESIKFFIGDILLGATVGAAKVLTPVNLFPDAIDYTDERVTNMLRFLQTLDADGDPTNGIDIPQEALDNAAGLTLDFSEPAFSANAQGIINTLLPGTTPALVSAAAAQKHFRSTLKGVSSVATARDDKGVFFITGPKTASYYDIFAAMGYAVAEDRLWQIEKFRRLSNGTLAEIFGPSQLGSDTAMRTTGYTQQELEDAYNALSDRSKAVLKGYATGINQRIDEIVDGASLLPFEFANAPCGEFTPAYWDAFDIMVWAAAMQRNFDPEARGMTGQIDNLGLAGYLQVNHFPNWEDMFDDLRWNGNDPDAITYIPGAAPVKKGGAGGAGGANIDPAMLEGLKDFQERQQQIKENLKAINADIKMGSYAWVVDGSKTQSGNPIIYSGPQMGFTVPSIISEASIKAGELNVSGMFVPGIPGIVIGRTPHHAWSMQVGHAHTVDYYEEAAQDIVMTRTETINVLGQAPVDVVVARTAHGPVVNNAPMLSWKYSHWGYELDIVDPLMGVGTATNMDEFGAAIDKMSLSQHFCYADVDGNIGYWMSGRDPVRPVGEWRFPQGSVAPALEWDAAVIKARSTDRNTDQHYYCGWNNKSSATYESTKNNFSYFFGPFHRAHVVDEYLAANDNLTFEDVRDLALNIATTDSFGSGGNPWAFVGNVFSATVQASNPTITQTQALAVFQDWDGHFVRGGDDWATGTNRDDAWMLMDAWTREVIDLTFQDELSASLYDAQKTNVLFNVLLHSFPESSIQMQYDWFSNVVSPTAPQTFDDIVVAALDNALADLGAQPWGTGQRDVIEYWHDFLGKVWEMPFSSRSTYAHVVEFSPNGPVRVESMFPLGPSGNIDRTNPVFTPANYPNAFSLTGNFDAFSPRDFPAPQ